MAAHDRVPAGDAEGVRAPVGTRGAAAPRLDVRPVGPRDVEALARVLESIDSDYFQPHPMTREEARRIGALDGRDVYLIGFVDGDPVAYGMLRGWDEGYEVPSLGIGVRRDRVRRGFGRQMILALHEVARRAGASQVRLRVHPENEPAATLYRSLGYREIGFERGEIVMTVDLQG